MKSHLEEWREIKERYDYMIKNGFTKEISKENLKYRIERIDHLISSEESQKEFNHFK